MNQSRTYNLDSRARPDSSTALHGGKKRISIFNGGSATTTLRKESIGQNKIMVAGKRFHLIGAGGIGMSGLAALLIKNDAIVTGSDQTSTNVTKGLCLLGADIKTGHKVENLDPDTDAIVISAAIREDNPELKAARQKGCIVYKYAEMLGELMSFYEGIAVAGTHGKSTTSGWLTYLLKQSGVDTNFIIGAEISQLGISSGVAESKYFVAEACEYDRSFLNLKPKIACILNIEQDHLDYYKDEDDIVEAFMEFARGTKPDGVLILNGRDANVEKIIRGLKDDIRYETFGPDEKCDFYANNISLENGYFAFDVYHRDNFLGRTTISLPGEHNIQNSLAVIAMAVNLGLEPQRTLNLLGGFTGMDRRLMLKGRFGNITVLDDYAHHPTEIRASLAAIRQKYQPKRLWCVFQPHQYSRTRFLLDDFTESFKLADVTIVPEIYFVRDSISTRQQINAQILVERMKVKGTQAMFIEDFGNICDYLENNVASGDIVVTMGAGDIWKVADEYIQWLRRNS
ncbi:MAG: UDP-N-acetylmuramate--L-alanine ligase [Sedimentisphaerales bacterium]|nr:UDP-N-acetylmuramate--L-alanine ligase [Sedimentisphaerales bacterium]